MSEVNITRQEIRSEGLGAGSMQGTAAGQTAARSAALAVLLAAVFSLQITKTNADGNFLTTKGRKEDFFHVFLRIKAMKKRSSS